MPPQSQDQHNSSYAAHAAPALSSQSGRLFPGGSHTGGAVRLLCDTHEERSRSGFVWGARICVDIRTHVLVCVTRKPLQGRQGRSWISCDGASDNLSSVIGEETPSPPASPLPSNRTYQAPDSGNGPLNEDSEETRWTPPAITSPAPSSERPRLGAGSGCPPRTVANGDRCVGRMPGPIPRPIVVPREEASPSPTATKSQRPLFESPPAGSVESPSSEGNAGTQGDPTDADSDPPASLFGNDSSGSSDAGGNYEPDSLFGD